jgi:hypothetical protein
MTRLQAQLAASLVLSTMLGLPAVAQSVVVSAQSNIYSSGHSAIQSNCVTGIGPGIFPVLVDLPQDARTIMLRDVTGTVSYCSGCARNGPDGISASLTTWDSLNGISGLIATRIRCFEGIFLTDSEPVDPPPPPLTFTAFDFLILEPTIAQHFFVGDGLTGTGEGRTQAFLVPAGATRMFLGFTDGFPPCIGAYGDNSGNITATVVINGAGAVPPHSLRASKAAGGQITLMWDASCAAADSDYGIYEGSLGSYFSHVPLFCSTGGATNWTFTPGNSSTYYLVVPASGGQEGSYGATSGGTERPQGTPPCSPNAALACS